MMTENTPVMTTATTVVNEYAAGASQGAGVTSGGTAVAEYATGADTSAAPTKVLTQDSQQTAEYITGAGVSVMGSEAAVVTEDDLLEAEANEPSVSPYDRPGKWFVLHTQSGYEKRVKSNLEARTASMNMEGRIHEVVIPMRDVPEFKNGKKVISSKRLFPGYVFVRCDFDNDVWTMIRDTPNVSGFVSGPRSRGDRPSPLKRDDVETYLADEDDSSREASKRAKPLFEYGIGDTVRVKDGPFADFSGEIVEINEDQLKIKVLVNIFGRETPTEVGFAQVARL